MILMRHRAVLLGLVGGLTSLAAFLPQYQNIAFAAGFISVLSYIWLMMSVGGANPQLQRVFAVDGIALACLVIGSLARVYMHFRISP